MQKATIAMSFKARVLSLIYILGCASSVRAGLLLSPSEEAVVCEGELLELMCTTNGSFLGWKSLIPLEQGNIHSYSRYIFAMDETDQASSYGVNFTSFNASRVSSIEELPLVIRLVINPVNTNLNGTKVNCTDQITSMNGNVDFTTLPSTTVTIIVIGDIHSYNPKRPEVKISIIEHKVDNITILFEWTPETGVIYNVSAKASEPVVVTINSITTANANLTVPYNTHINVSITATSCGQNSTIIKLYYAACENPLDEVIDDTSHIEVIGYNKPALEGASIIFHCPPGMELTGSERATCMGNGEWEPDPRSVTCNETLLIPTTSQDAVVCTSNEDSMPLPQCMSDGNASGLGTLIGSLIGFGSLGLLVTITIIMVFIILKRKGSFNFKRKSL